MTIELIAMLKSKEVFFEQYATGNNMQLFKGGNLLLYAIQNTNLESRYSICNFLLDVGSDLSVRTQYGDTALHLLLSRTNHSLEKTIALCSRLVDGGIDLNALNNKNESAITHLVNMKYTDEQLQPLYDILLGHSLSCLNSQSLCGKTPLDLARSRPYRRTLLTLLEDSIKNF